MANDLNQCNFIGRLGQDVELRYTQDGKAIANISLAVGWKSKNSEGVEWVRCVAFDKLAEIMGHYLSKGSRIFVSGRQRTRKWQNQQGQDQYTTEIVISDMQMLDSRDGQSAQGGGQQRQQQQRQPVSGMNAQQPNPRAPATQPLQQSQGGGGTNPTQDEFIDDIPF